MNGPGKSEYTWPVMGKHSDKTVLLRSKIGFVGYISWGVSAAPGKSNGVAHFFFGFFYLKFFRAISMCPLIVAADGSKNLLALAAVNSGTEE